MNNIDWIFFDVGGVLLDDTAAMQEQRTLMLEILHTVNPRLTLKDIESIQPELSKNPRGLMSNTIAYFSPDEETGDRLIKEFKERFPSTRYNELSMLRPEALKTISNLRERYQLGLMGNQPHATIEKLQEVGILEYFHHQKVSAHYGFTKPDPRFFKAVLEDVGTDPTRSVVVDDNIERSLIPAKELGMTTVWYKLEERSTPENVIDYTITSLTDLGDFLGGWYPNHLIG